MSGAPIRADLEVLTVDDGLVVVAPDGGAVSHLNHTAAAILGFCDGTRTPDQIAVAVGRRFRLAAAPRQATRACIEALLGAGLLS